MRLVQKRTASSETFLESMPFSMKVLIVALSSLSSSYTFSVSLLSISVSSPALLKFLSGVSLISFTVSKSFVCLFKMVSAFVIKISELSGFRLLISEFFL